MVAVGDVILVCYTLDDTKALLQALGKFVSGGLQRGAVDGEVNVLLLFPLVAGVV